MDDDDILIIDDDEESEEGESSQTWCVLLVDDEPEIHQVTKVALGQFEFEDRPLNYAYSGKEACEVMEKQADVAMILLDVVMEHDHAGLDVVKYVRDKIGNNDVRIVLRTVSGRHQKMTWSSLTILMITKIKQSSLHKSSGRFYELGCVHIAIFVL